MEGGCGGGERGGRLPGRQRRLLFGSRTLVGCAVSKQRLQTQRLISFSCICYIHDGRQELSFEPMLEWSQRGLLLLSASSTGASAENFSGGTLVPLVVGRMWGSAPEVLGCQIKCLPHAGARLCFPLRLPEPRLNRMKVSLVELFSGLSLCVCVCVCVSDGWEI